MQLFTSKRGVNLKKTILNTKIPGVIALSLGLVAFCYSQTLRFGWLTDTHIGSENAAEELKVVVTDLNRQAGVAFVVVSGDVTEMDVGDNLLQAKEILDQLKVPYYIIPGNHDTKWSDSGGQRFRRLWGADKFDFSSAGIGFIGFSQGPVLRMADGLIAPQDLRWLKEKLSKSHKRSEPLLFFTHYPLDSSVSNYRDFYQIIEGYNAQAVLCGHVHANRVTEVFGLPVIMSRATKSDRKQSTGYTMVELWGDTLKFFERVPAADGKELWYSRRLKNQPYHPVQKDSNTPIKAPTDVVARWEFQSDYLISASPVSDAEHIYIGDYGGNFYALAVKNGAVVWQRKFPAPILATAAIEQPYVVFGSGDSNIYCLRTKNGQLVWKVSTNAPVLAAPVIAKGIVYIGGSDGIFRAIDLKSGQIIWQNTSIAGYVECQPLLTKSLVIFGTWANKLYALAQDDGKLAWCWQAGTPGDLYSPAACYPVYSKEKIFIVAPDRYLTAIEAATGATVWRTNYHKVRESLGINQDGTKVFARCLHDTVFAVDPQSDKPLYIWEVRTGYGYDFAPAPVVEKEGKIYFGTKNGIIYCLNAADGKLLWRHRVGVSLVNTICPLNSHTIVLTLLEGKVSCLNIPN